jgi:hypothetical protein
MPQDASSQQSVHQPRRSITACTTVFFCPDATPIVPNSLADILKQLKLEPSRYAPITTVSSGNTQVVCNAVLPLSDGGKVVIDYSFYWQGSQANIRYSVTRK